MLGCSRCKDYGLHRKGALQKSLRVAGPLTSRTSGSGLSSVDKVAEAFGSARVEEPPDQDAARTSRAESGGAADSRSRDGDTIAALLPPELRKLTDFLYVRFAAALGSVTVH